MVGSALLPVRAKKVASCALVPISSGTAWVAPVAAASTGCTGRNSPSTTGAKQSTPGVVSFAQPSSVEAARTRASGPAASSAAAASGSSAPRSPTNCAAQPADRTGPYAVAGAELWAIARWNRPRAAGTASSVVTAMPPADSP